VTGVQTCALPISSSLAGAVRRLLGVDAAASRRPGRGVRPGADARCAFRNPIRPERAAVVADRFSGAESAAAAADVPALAAEHGSADHSRARPTGPALAQYPGRQPPADLAVSGARAGQRPAVAVGFHQPAVAASTFPGLLAAAATEARPGVLPFAFSPNCYAVHVRRLRPCTA